MDKEKRKAKSVFLLFPFILGMIFVKNVSKESLGLLFQQLKQYGPVITLVLFIISLLCGINRAIYGKKNQDAVMLRSGVALLFIGTVGAIISIALIFI